ncbi:putative ribonuclease H-like domain-containing protein [Tanacetum coccineum]
MAPLPGRGEEEKKDAEHPENEDSEVLNTEEPRVNQENDENVNNTNNINTVSSTVDTASIKDKAVDENIVYGCADDPNKPNLEEIVYSDFENVSAEAGMTNLDSHIPVSPIPTTRIHKDHPVEQIIRDIYSTPQTRRMTKSVTEHVEPKKVWTLVDLPYGQRAIGTKWVYRNKKDERGIVIRNKARLVAQGYTQEEGIDYDEVFAPVARIEAIRLFLAYASFKDFGVYQMDAKSAFLYGKIEEEFYVCQPPGFEDPEFPDRVYKVEKALYGLHQAPRAWYETLSTYLLDNGFQRGTIDKTLFIKKVKGDILLVQVYVDDIIFGFTKKGLCTEFEKLMHKKFQMSSIASTPIETSKPLLKDAEAEDVDVHLYRLMIGSLMYLTSSKRDIMFAVCACARFQVTPKASHLHVVKRIFRYLTGQPKLGLWYPNDSPFDLEAYTDNDYAGASLDRKSTTGGCQFLGSKLISWQCKKQTVVANSTTEAEYVAASSCYGQVLWIQNQLLDYGYNFMNTKIFIDNESTICIMKNLMFHSKTKHIEIRHHFIRDSYEKRLIQVIKIHTDHNVADLLTKAFDIDDWKGMQQLLWMKLRLKLVTIGVTTAEDETVHEERGDSVERAATNAASLDAKQDNGNILRTQSTAYSSGNWFRIESSAEKSFGDQEDASKQGRNEDQDEYISWFQEDAETQGRYGHDIDITTASAPITIVGVSVSTAEPSTPPTTTTVIEDEDLTIAQTLLKMRSEKSKEKAKEKGVSSETATRPTRGVTMQEPSETASIPIVPPQQQLDPKDKGKGKMVEQEKPLKKKDQIAFDEEVARRLEAQMQAELEEEERADYELAQRIQAEEQGELTIEERSKLFVELIDKRKKHFAKLRAEEIRRKPPTKAQMRNQMCTYLRNMANYKHSQLKNKSFKEIQMLFDNTMKWIDSFVPMDSERQKLEDDAEKAELKACLEIVPKDDEAVNVESLATKYPIVDWKTHILAEDKMYYENIRADGSTKYYKIFSAILDDFDRQYVLDLYRLVKERFETASPEGYDRLLWGDLITLFEPSEEDKIWKAQQDYTLISWRLFDSCGVHLLLMDTGIAIHMLVERKYPLTQEMLSRMLNRRLEVDHESEMAFELLRFTRSQLKK